jgi:hypothetical protein
METIRGIVHAGKVELVEPVGIPEGTEVLVTLPDDGDKQFWLKASERIAGCHLGQLRGRRL